MHEYICSNNIKYCGDYTIKRSNNAAPKTMWISAYTKFIVSSITIGIVLFVIYILLLLLSSSIDGSYPNERLLLYALTDQQTNQTTSALNKKGLDLINSGDYSEAITYFDKALAMNSSNVNALNNKAFALYSLGNYSEAISYYDKALAIEPDDATVLNNKGLVLYSLGSYYEAIKYIDKALAIEPDDALALDNKNKILDLLSKQK